MPSRLMQKGKRGEPRRYRKGRTRGASATPGRARKGARGRRADTADLRASARNQLHHLSVSFGRWTSVIPAAPAEWWRARPVIRAASSFVVAVGLLKILHRTDRVEPIAESECAQTYGGNSARILHVGVRAGTPI